MPSGPGTGHQPPADPAVPRPPPYSSRQPRPRAPRPSGPQVQQPPLGLAAQDTGPMHPRSNPRPALPGSPSLLREEKAETSSQRPSARSRGSGTRCPKRTAHRGPHPAWRRPVWPSAVPQPPLLTGLPEPKRPGRVPGGGRPAGGAAEHPSPGLHPQRPRHSRAAHPGQRQPGHESQALPLLPCQAGENPQAGGRGQGPS